MSVVSPKPRLTVGTSDFAKLREAGTLYVDKTDLIGRVVDGSGEVLLFPRPRRFGKTTNLSMLRYFLGKSEKDHAPLFQELAVWQSAAARLHFQRYPVIYLTFKDVKQATWPDCLNSIAGLLSDLYEQHAYLLEDKRLSSAAAEAFTLILHRRAQQVRYEEALRELSRLLCQYHGQPVVILIDEYDTPLHTAFARGYYDEAAGFFRGFLSGGLKDNQYLFKGVLTGILRIARESLFSGLNNLAVYSLLSRDFATDFGFTESEVQGLLQRAGSDRTMDDLRRWYNGYSFGGQVIYNPWSVVNALMRSNDPLQPYWVNTASDELIRELIFRVGGGEAGELETLLQGQGVRKTLRQDIVLRDIHRDPDALWSFLLFTGYLKAEDVRVEEVGIGSRITGELKLPNREVASVFANLFGSWLHMGLGGERPVQELLQGLLSGDLELFAQHLSRLLLESASFLDASGDPVKMPPEHVYQAFILGLLVQLQPRFLVKSNREAGHGRYDVMVIPRESGQPGVVLELKVKKKGETLQGALGGAKKQLLARDYAAELRALGAVPIQQVAVAFDGKKVLVASAAAPARRGKKP